MESTMPAALAKNRRLAAIAAIAMPGLGQIYNGDLLRGVCFYAIFLMVPVAGLRAAVLLPDRLLFAGVLATILATLAVYVATIVDAAARAGSARSASWRRWYVYVVAWLAGSIFANSLIFGYVERRVMQFCSIPTGSMAPAVLPGDFVIVDKSAPCRFSPHRGDIVTFVDPDDRSRLYIKRIAGLPGDTVAADGAHGPVVVPHGRVFVLGDNRGHAVDSRTFGTIPLQDLRGKARQVYFSVGPGGIRWERIGRSL